MCKIKALDDKININDLNNLNGRRKQKKNEICLFRINCEGESSLEYSSSRTLFGFTQISLQSHQQLITSGAVMLTEFPIAEAFLLHLSLQSSHHLQLRLLFLHRVPQMLQFLLLRGRLQLSVLLLLQEMQALLLLRTGSYLHHFSY